MKKTKQIALRIPSSLWETLQKAAKTEITEAPKRTGPPSQTAEFIRQLILEGVRRRGLKVTEVQQNE